MSTARWYPPDGAVAIQAGPAISCSACGLVENAGTPRNAIRMRNRHRCPPGTPGAVPRCPTCDSTDQTCILVDGTNAPMWHPARTAAWHTGRQS